MKVLSPLVCSPAALQAGHANATWMEGNEYVANVTMQEESNETHDSDIKEVLLSGY